MSDRQRSLLFALAQRAASNVGEPMEVYRKRVLNEVLRFPSFKAISSQEEVDAIKRIFEEDCGDYLAAIDTSIQNIKRVAYLIKVCAIQIMQLKGGSECDARQYLGGILDTAKIANGHVIDTDEWYMDVSPRSVHSVLHILDTYRRRLIRRFCRDSVSLKLDDSVRYEIDGPIFYRFGVDRQYYDQYPFSVNVVMK